MGRGCRYARTQVHLLSQQLVVCLFHGLLLQSPGVGNIIHTGSYTEQLICGYFWCKHFKIEPLLEIITPFQSDSDQNILLCNKTLQLA